MLDSSRGSVVRKPSLAKQLFGYVILSFALTEAIALLYPTLYTRLAGKEVPFRLRNLSAVSFCLSGIVILFLSDLKLDTF